jgi:RNase adaptor protein for sRNA GlmZ degradation
VQQQQQHSEARYRKTLAYNIRHLPNPPRHLRVKATGLSRRLQKEFLQNDNVEAFLVKVQGEICNAVKEGCDQLLHSVEEQDENKQGAEEADQRSISKTHSSEQAALEGADDIGVVVTICCEEGRHRSVAFVEELARRLAVLKDEDGFSQHWKPTVNVIHRDISDVGEGEQSLGQNKRPNKAQAKSRQRERREKGNRYKSELGDDD